MGVVTEAWRESLRDKGFSGKPGHLPRGDQSYPVCGMRGAAFRGRGSRTQHRHRCSQVWTAGGVGQFGNFPQFGCAVAISAFPPRDRILSRLGDVGNTAVWDERRRDADFPVLP